MRTLDSLILDTAGLTPTGAQPAADTILISNDPTGALTRVATATNVRVVILDADYARCQAARHMGADVAGETRLDEYLAGASGNAIIVGEMPKSLARLDYLARAIAGAGFSKVDLVLGANNKHLSRSMNQTLAQSFTTVTGSRGRGKFRCLVASGPRSVTYKPRRANGFVAIGGVFSGVKADRGAMLLRSSLPAEPGRLLDLGCGNGAVSRGLHSLGGVYATDSDVDAVLSARAIGLNATWDDAGSRYPTHMFETIALNPPFHDGNTIDATLVQHLLDAVVRLLAPDGSLYMVHNSHLRYRGEVERRFTNVKQVERDAMFTVLRARSAPAVSEANAVG